MTCLHWELLTNAAPEWLVFPSGKSKVKETQTANREMRRRLFTPAMISDRKRCLWNKAKAVASCGDCWRMSPKESCRGQRQEEGVPQRRPPVTRSRKQWSFSSVRLSGALPVGSLCCSYLNPHSKTLNQTPNCLRSINQAGQNSMPSDQRLRVQGKAMTPLSVLRSQHIKDVSSSCQIWVRSTIILKMAALDPLQTWGFPYESTIKRLNVKT